MPYNAIYGRYVDGETEEFSKPRLMRVEQEGGAGRSSKNTIYGHMWAGKGRNARSHALCGRGQGREYQQAGHIRAHVGGAKGCIRNSALYRRGQDSESSKQGIYGRAKGVSRAREVSETTPPCRRVKTWSSSKHALYGCMWAGRSFGNNARAGGVRNEASARTAYAIYSSNTNFREASRSNA